MENEELEIHRDRAFWSIISRTYNGYFDFSFKEILFFVPLSEIIRKFFATESAKFYLVTGGRGTKYLPIGTFSTQFGSQQAYRSNATINWFFIMKTIIDARNSYYQYQLAKELGLPVSIKKEVLKFSRAAVLSVMSGFVMGLIADINYHMFYNALVTGGVNAVLSYVGSIALEVLITTFLFKLKKTFCHRYRSQSDFKETESLHYSAQWIPKRLESKAKNQQIGIRCSRAKKLRF